MGDRGGGFRRMGSVTRAEGRDAGETVGAGAGWGVGYRGGPAGGSAWAPGLAAEQPQTTPYPGVPDDVLLPSVQLCRHQVITRLVTLLLGAWGLASTDCGCFAACVAPCSIVVGRYLVMMKLLAPACVAPCRCGRRTSARSGKRGHSARRRGGSGTSATGAGKSTGVVRRARYRTHGPRPA